MRPSGIEPASLPRIACETAVCPLSYGRIAHWAGGCLIRRFGEGRGLVSFGPFSPPGIEIQAPKTAQTHPNPPKPSQTHPFRLLLVLLVLVLRLLLHYSCY